MRALLPVAVICLLGTSLSGCVVAEVASAGVGIATTVVSTTAHVAGSVVRGTADAVTGDSDDDKDSDDSDHHHHHHDSDDDDGDK